MSDNVPYWDNLIPPWIKERYQNDPAFHSLIQNFESMILQYGFTPNELFEGLKIAHEITKNEPRRPRRPSMRCSEHGWKMTDPNGNCSECIANILMKTGGRL